MSTAGIDVPAPEEARPSGPPLNVPKQKDTMPAATLGMWLFLASEAMFFIALLASFVVLESAGGQHHLFSNSAAMLSKSIGIFSAIALVASSLALRWGFKRIAISSAVLLLGLQLVQCLALLTHHTIVSRDSGRLTMSDVTNWPGHATVWSSGRQMSLPKSVDLHAVTASDFQAITPLDYYGGDQILQDLSYGPSRNNFFACYFFFTGAHALHMIAGMIALVWFLFLAGGKLPPALQIYWHFVNAVGVLSLATLYWV